MSVPLTRRELHEPAVAVSILRDLRDDLRRKIEHTCQECGTAFDYAGELDHHLRFVHGVEEVDT
jgi:5-methylcytosine-specific restriction endonuclease McrA